MRIRFVVSAFIVFVSLVVTQPARAATVDPPQRIKVQKLDQTDVEGRITSYDQDGFEVMDLKKQTSKLSWDEFPPTTVIDVYKRLVRPKSPDDTADKWLDFGKKLLTMPGGRAPAEQAFGRALALDKTLKDKIAAARKEAGAADATRPATQRATPPARIGENVDPHTATTQPRGPFDARDPNKKIPGPQRVGEVDPNAWAKQSAQQQIENVKPLKAFAERTREEMRLNLQPYDTPYFLVYSDLSPSEAQKWVLKLDAMYARLSQLFGVPQNENIWHGKALIFIFSRDLDYQKFEVKMHDTVAVGTAGMCHTFGNGDVHIAFYRQPNELDFAHVLVHESVHAFLHRYHSPVEIPSWANEGLAEAIATDLVPRKGLAQSSLAEARQDLQTRKSMEQFFDLDHIVAWQYPVARTLTEFMIRTNKQGYVEFINAVKDGQPWPQALRTKYGVTPEQLVTGYGQSIGVPGVKP